MYNNLAALLLLFAALQYSVPRLTSVGTSGGAVANPTINPTTTQFIVPSQNQLADATSGSSIAYSTDGSTVTTSTIASTAGTNLFPAPPCTIIVTGTGSGASNGRPPNGPTTLVHAFSVATIVSGVPDTVCITGGTTYTVSSTINPSNSGSYAAGNITYIGYNGTPIIEWTGASGQDIVEAANTFPNAVSYLTFENIAWKGGSAAHCTAYPCSNTLAYSAIRGIGGSHYYSIDNYYYNFGAAGFAPASSDYIRSIHDVFWMNGATTGDSSAVDFFQPTDCDTIGGFCGTGGAYNGFHNIVAFDLVIATFDGQSGTHTDGNGIIEDNGFTGGSTNFPAMLVIGNVSVGNGGRGIACDQGSNMYVVNNSTYMNGLDSGQANVDNGEMDANDCNNVVFVNNIMDAYNSHSPLAFLSTAYNAPWYCADNYISGGSVVNNQCTNAATSASPNYINPTAFSSPVITNGGTNQNFNVLPNTTGTLNHFWPSATHPGINPETIPGLTANEIADMHLYDQQDINGIARNLSSMTAGAYVFQSGSILFTPSTYFYLNTGAPTAIQAIGFKAGFPNSSIVNFSQNFNTY